MNWQSLLDPDIQKFIRDHEKDDVAALALKKPSNPDWDCPLVLDQIKARQKAAKKIPLWLTQHEDIIFPPANVMEQASSAATARYKASLVRGKSFADLTGGAGVDTCALTEHFEHGFCIERNEDAAELIAHNMPLLSDTPVEVSNTTAENFVQTMPHVDLAIIDPQRRDEHQKGKFRLESCTPDIFALLPKLQEKTKYILIKTSPMLDISQTIEDLKTVSAVHVVEWKGECKELLFILQKEPCETPLIAAVSVNDEGEALKKLEFTLQQEKECIAPLSLPLKYLYEPGPAFQKSGGFNIIAEKYGVKKLHPHTHLYTSENQINDFPGRIFEILGQYPVQAAKIPVKQANLAVRNFPMSTPDLKKKLKIKDGGSDYIFACTLENKEKILIHGRKT